MAWRRWWVSSGQWNTEGLHTSGQRQGQFFAALDQHDPRRVTVVAVTQSYDVLDARVLWAYDHSAALYLGERANARRNADGKARRAQQCR
jgi:hypothetical protein